MAKKTKKAVDVMAEVKDYHHEINYVPVLKGKAGEFDALCELTTLQKSQIYPLIEIPTVNWDYEKGKMAKTLQAHIETVVKKMLKSCHLSYPIMVDTHQVKEVMENGIFVIDYILTEAKKVGLEVVPIVRLNSTSDYINSLLPHLKKNPRVAIRAFSKEQRDLSVDVNNLVARLGLIHPHVDLILDMEFVHESDEVLYQDRITLQIEGMANVTKFNSLTVAMTSFPQDLSGFAGDSMSQISRSEWRIWNNLVGGKLKRKPVFGDYAIAHPEINEIDPRLLKMSASIRYTYKETWVIVKGRNVRDYSFDQFYDLSQILVASTCFYGKDFSWGDDMIYQKSLRLSGTGNPSTWRAIGTNHHIAVVLEQLTSS